MTTGVNKTRYMLFHYGKTEILKNTNLDKSIGYLSKSKVENQKITV